MLSAAAVQASVQFFLLPCTSTDPENVDGPTRLFQVLQDLEDAHHTALFSSGTLTDRDRNCLLELQT